MGKASLWPPLLPRDGLSAEPSTILLALGRLLPEVCGGRWLWGFEETFPAGGQQGISVWASGSQTLGDQGPHLPSP